MVFECKTSSLKVVDGKIKVPTGAGLGVDIDPALVKKPAGKGLMNCFRPRGLHARAIAGRMPPRNGLTLDMGVISGIMGISHHDMPS